MQAGPSHLLVCSRRDVCRVIGPVYYVCSIPRPASTSLQLQLRNFLYFIEGRPCWSWRIYWGSHGENGDCWSRVNSLPNITRSSFQETQPKSDICFSSGPPALFVLGSTRFLSMAILWMDLGTARWESWDSPFHPTRKSEFWQLSLASNLNAGHTGDG